MLQMLQAFVVFINQIYGREKGMERFEEFFNDPLRGALLPDVAWLHAMEYFEPHSDSEWQSEELKWRQQRENFPTYYSLIQVVQDDAIKANTFFTALSSWRLYFWRKWFSIIGCWIVPLQICYSSEARKTWKAVAMHYFMFFFMSAGCWTDRIVNKLALIEKFRAFQSSIITVEDDHEVVRTMENPLYSRSSIFIDKAATIIVGGGSRFARDSDISTSRVESTASTDYDLKEMFVQYLSATTSCRSVVWQIVPGMTAFAILAVDTSTCPILVFSKRLKQYLHPLIAFDAWGAAQTQREITLLSQRPKYWQIWLVVACFLWMQDSRLVQFLLKIFVNAISFYIIFNSVKFGRTLVDIHRIFFDNNNNNSSEEGENSTN